jgi:hypothetical protein
MPKPKRIDLDLKKIFRHQKLDDFMFNYVIGIKRGLPAITLEQAINEFMNHYGLQEEEYPLQTSIQTYYTMLKQYYEYSQTHE